MKVVNDAFHQGFRHECLCWAKFENVITKGSTYLNPFIFRRNSGYFR